MISDNTSLEEFREMSCMTARCYNVCVDAGIKTFGDFMDYVFQMDQHINMGKKTFQEILSLKSKYKDERISRNSDIDYWEQRRYETAKAAMIGLMAGHNAIYEAKKLAPIAIEYADAIIAELKKGGNKHEADS